MTIKFTVHPIAGTNEPPSGFMYAIMPDDGSTGYMVGTLDDCAMLSAALDALLLNKTHGKEIDELDERLGWTWVNVAQAVELAEDHGQAISGVYIRRAMREGKIAGAKREGRDWRAPQARFLGWLLKGRKPRGPHKKDS